MKTAHQNRRTREGVFIFSNGSYGIRPLYCGRPISLGLNVDRAFETVNYRFDIVRTELGPSSVHLDDKNSLKLND